MTMSGRWKVLVTSYCLQEVIQQRDKLASLKVERTQMQLAQSVLLNYQQARKTESQIITLGPGKGKEAWYLVPCPAFVNVG